MNFNDNKLDIDPLIRRYCEQHSSTPHSLRKIEKSTYLNTVKPANASDEIQGRFLSFVSKLVQPHFIVEVGTFTAYSTICLAEGLVDTGTIISIEKNMDLQPLIDHHLSLTDSDKKIEILYGDASDILPTIEKPVDLVFIDAAKRHYLEYLEILLPRVRVGGVIIADNVLWKSEVLSPKSKIARSLDHFNNMVRDHQALENFILPYRDGINLIRKVI